TYRTLMETLKEVRRCTQDGITINSFMLESNYQLVDFIDQMTRINRGRAFYTTPDQLGRYVLVDYVTNRRKRVS
ncbi:MAG: VWA domain-containing protein, partial [Chloroflexota bacterium]|nr:VWA domain-containing protein [Chloroflexota bacterium]